MADIDGQKRAVVHGDIKPSNIQVGSNDEIRLLDFGIAKAITFTHSLTHHNLGSPSYCSPERLSRGQVDLHADLWAVGVTLYEMVAGLPPYQAEDTRKLETLIQSRRPPRALPDNCPAGLKAVITKALAGDLHQRYASAAAFESDLRLFLQDRTTLAEGQKRVSWNSNATVERARENEPPVRPKPELNATVGRDEVNRITDIRTWWKWRPSGLIARIKPEWSSAKIAGVLSILGALCWGVFAGLMVSIPSWYLYRYWSESSPLRGNPDESRKTIAEINSDFDLFRRLDQENSFLGRWSPTLSLRGPLKENLLATADEILDRFRNSNDPVLEDFDWQKARLCLQHAIDMGDHSMAIRGKLALCDGYIDLSQAEKAPPDARQQWIQKAKTNFDQASMLLSRAPDPHLALARLDVYGMRNIGMTVAELHEAQRLGFQLGAREMEEEADGYRFRAIEELSEARKYGKGPRELQQRFLRLAQRDFDRARQLYEPIAGFSNVSVALRQVDDDDRTREQLYESLNQPVKKPAAGRARRRWR